MSSVLVVGSGGREHALAWALSRSSDVERLIVAPGNPGTALCDRTENTPVAADDVDGLVRLSRRESVGLVVVGPEVPLAAGLADALTAADVAVFGPSAACARLEASKAHSKRFMVRNGIPTAPARVFRASDEAVAHLDGLLASGAGLPVVKASGLAAGKGVTVPESRGEAVEAIEDMLVRGRFGAAGAEILLEERLHGVEASLLAFCDGAVFKMLPPAQDHKRLLAGSEGPNTGGMGALAPSPAVDGALIDRIGDQVIAPALEALADDGTPYRGLLYAGMMLTDTGPKVVEFNCRFGDPEAQALIPLLRSDLFEAVSACAAGTLDGIDLAWSDETAVTVVMASAGYPASPSQPAPIEGLEAAADIGCTVFHAATSLIDGTVHAGSGRVLNVTATGEDLESAADLAHRGVAAIGFAGAQHRADIGRPGQGSGL